MKKDSVQRFSEAFQNFLIEENLEDTFVKKRLIANLEKVMHKSIASRTESIYFKDKILYIKLSSAPLRNTMVRSKPAIIKLVKEEIGQDRISDIRFL